MLTAPDLIPDVRNVQNVPAVQRLAAVQDLTPVQGSRVQKFNVIKDGSKWKPCRVVPAQSVDSATEDCINGAVWNLRAGFLGVNRPLLGERKAGFSRSNSSTAALIQSDPAVSSNRTLCAAVPYDSCIRHNKPYPAVSSALKPVSS